MPAVNPFDLVIFGGTGDLATRKLLPAMYHRHLAGQLPGNGRIFALGRSELSREDYLESVRGKCREQIGEARFDDARWQEFSARIDYLKVEACSEADFAALRDRLGQAGETTRIYYLSTPPSLFAGICRRLAAAGLASENSRVVLEKPLGSDFETSSEISACIESVFDENQTYRIDHYLGKETVQNLMALRFGNAIFEPLWSQGKIRDVQITLAEKIGIEGRGEFYDATGALRDMVQNHLMQLLCIVAMEPPISMSADNVRDEKLKVLRSLQPFTADLVETNTVRGQYDSGVVCGEKVPGYLQEAGVDPGSGTETFVALKTEINNWRWAGVPFFLRTGKRMHEHVSEVVVNFYSLPHSIFPVQTGTSDINRLYIRLQPNETIELHLMAKQAGDGYVLKPVKLDLDLVGQETRHLDAYEKLLMDVIRGNQTLFVRHDELSAAWQWIEPVLHAWETSLETLRRYPAGTHGPNAARKLIGNSGIRWIEDI